MSERYPLLFSRLRIGPFETANRIVSAPHSTMFAERNRVSDQHLAYYGARARGGAGVVMIGGLRVHPTTVAGDVQLALLDDGCLAGLCRLAETVHAGGARIVGQLLHVGRQRNGGQPDVPAWAPSPLPSEVSRTIPHELTVAEIAELVESYARAAAYCRAAGFDGIEIHAAHGYLPQQFLSPLANVRDDEYGGTPENRRRFLLDVLAACHEAAGAGLAVGVRISGDELVEGGLGLDEMSAEAAVLVRRGAQFLNVSYSTYSGLSYAAGIPEMGTPPGAFAHLAAGIRRAIAAEVPVFAVGRIVDPAQAEAIIADGTADAVTMARALIADPEWPAKARAGQADRIRRCIGCNQGCAGMIHTGRRMRCLTNPVVGREAVWSLHPQAAPRRRRIVVVGAGPAGLEAALVASHRGHDVTLLDREDAAGGSARLAASLHGRDEFAGCFEWRVRSLAEARVELRLGVEADLGAVLSAEPDAVVIATGAEPAPVGLDGALPVEAALVDPQRIGPRVTIVDDDGAYRGCGVAEHLARCGHEVTVVTRLATVGADLPAMNYGPQIARLTAVGVRIHTLSEVLGVDGPCLVVRPAFGGPERRLEPADTILEAARRVARHELADVLAASAPQVEARLVGDCLAPRDAMHALRDGHAAGREL